MYVGLSEKVRWFVCLTSQKIKMKSHSGIFTYYVKYIKTVSNQATSNKLFLKSMCAGIQINQHYRIRYSLQQFHHADWPQARNDHQRRSASWPTALTLLFEIRNSLTHLTAIHTLYIGIHVIITTTHLLRYLIWNVQSSYSVLYRIEWRNQF